MPATPPFTVLLHLAAALTALVLGAVILFRRKGTTTHRWLGRVWLIAMLATAVGSFWIRTDGRFSWIHALSIWTLIAITIAFRHARQRRVRSHRRWIIGAYTGLVVAGAFTLLPSRFLGQLVRAWLA